MTPEVALDRRRALLGAALGFLEIEWTDRPPAPALALARWLGTWQGIGLIASGMHAQGFDLELRQYPAAWRANFYPTGIAHSIVRGSAWEPTPWRAVQRAARAGLAADGQGLAADGQGLAADAQGLAADAQ